MNERVEREYTRCRSDQLRSASVEKLPPTSIDTSCSSLSEKCCSESAGEFECETDVPTSKSDYVILHAPKNLINNSEVAMVCDRLKLSDNAATMILSTFIKACGGGVNDFCLSRSSTYRSRIASRQHVSQQIISEFSQNPTLPFTGMANYLRIVTEKVIKHFQLWLLVLQTSPTESFWPFKNLNKPAEKHKQKLPLKCWIYGS